MSHHADARKSAAEALVTMDAHASQTVPTLARVLVMDSDLGIRLWVAVMVGQLGEHAAQ